MDSITVRHVKVGKNVDNAKTVLFLVIGLCSRVWLYTFTDSTPVVETRVEHSCKYMYKLHEPSLLLSLYRKSAFTVLQTTFRG